MSRRTGSRLVWVLAGACLAMQLAALRTGWLNAFFFDTTAPYTKGVDFFPLARAFDNLVNGRSAFDTFHSSYGPYATWLIYHPAAGVMAAPLLLLAPWKAYAVWTAVSAAAMILSAVLICRQGHDPLRRAFVGLLLLGSFPGFLVLYSGNAQALLVLAVTLIFIAVDRLRQRSDAMASPGSVRTTERLLLAGLLLSLFTKPAALVMLPLLLLMRETRRTAVRALVVYTVVSAIFLVVPGLNPVAMSWPQRLSLLTHPAVVAATMNPYANGLKITPPMQDNIVHWLVMVGLNSFRMLHVDVYSFPLLLDTLLGRRTPDALFRVPLIFVLEITALVALLRSVRDRMEAALLTLMAAAILVLVSYGLIWEYHFTLLLPVAGMMLMRARPGWFERSVIALGWIAWAPSLYVLLRHHDITRIGHLNLLHAERVLPALVMFCLLLFRAAQIALRSPGGLRGLPETAR